MNGQKTDKNVIVEDKEVSVETVFVEDDNESVETVTVEEEEKSVEIVTLEDIMNFYENDLNIDSMVILRILVKLILWITRRMVSVAGTRLIIDYKEAPENLKSQQIIYESFRTWSH